MKRLRFNHAHLKQCMVILGYSFKTAALLEAALTHRSSSGINNERLEFLGDAILSFVIADQLYGRFSMATEGQLSRMRAVLVKGPTLAEIAQDLDLRRFLQLGLGEKRSGGFQRESILADALEAIIGAIYLDGGLECAQNCILQWYQERLDRLVPDACHKDPKTRLQEFLQARHFSLPIYTVLEIGGDPHHPIFRVHCSVEALALSEIGIGHSRRQAEQAGAVLLLEKLQTGEADCE